VPGEVSNWARTDFADSDLDMVMRYYHDLNDDRSTEVIASDLDLVPVSSSTSIVSLCRKVLSNSLVGSSSGRFRNAVVGQPDSVKVQFVRGQINVEEAANDLYDEAGMSFEEAYALIQSWYDLNPEDIGVTSGRYQKPVISKELIRSNFLSGKMSGAEAALALGAHDIELEEAHQLLQEWIKE
jgi:hypothetical protein